MVSQSISTDWFEMVVMEVSAEWLWVVGDLGWILLCLFFVVSLILLIEDWRMWKFDDTYFLMPVKT